MAKVKTVSERRKDRVRRKIKKVSVDRLRLSVFRSSNHIYAQLIDDRKGKTLASASSIDAELRKNLKTGGNIEAAKKVGALMAKRIKDAKVSKLVFDRGGYKYHGRIKALADALRENGLDI